MLYLVVDDRHGTPIHVFLSDDPRRADSFPKLRVHRVGMARADGGADPTCGFPVGAAVGRDPAEPARYREFRSDSAAETAGFVLIEPRYVGETWGEYVSAFLPKSRGASPPKAAMKVPRSRSPRA